MALLNPSTDTYASIVILNHIYVPACVRVMMQVLINGVAENLKSILFVELVRQMKVTHLTVDHKLPPPQPCLNNIAYTCTFLLYLLSDCIVLIPCIF
jgi:hypothetical protein